MKRLEIVLIFGFLLATPYGAWAQKNAPAKKTAPAGTQKAAKPVAGKKQVLRFDALTISGEAKKPQVYYLLNRKKIEIGHKPITWDFLQEIRESVEDEPF